jgi:ATP-binding cassette subfamily B protein
VSDATSAETPGGAAGAGSDSGSAAGSGAAGSGAPGSGGATRSLPSSGRVAFGIARHEPRAYAIALLTWITFYSLPVLSGVILKGVLDRIPVASGDVVWLFLAGLAGVELGRWAVFAFAVVQWHGCWVYWLTHPRVNLLRSLVRGPGGVAHRLPGSPGEAVSRFRDDTQNVGLVLDVWLDVTAVAVAAATAVVAMATVDARITLVVALPVVAALWLCRWLGHRLRVWRRREREATAAVTGFIGDVFGAIGTVKLAGARHAVADRFGRLGEVRADAARVDQVATQVLQTMSASVGHLGTGLVLLLLVPALGRGDASVGDVGLFAAAVTILAGVPRWAARYGAYVRQADVSVERLAELMPTPSTDGIVAAAPVHLRHGPGELPPVRPAGDGERRRTGDRLERLEVTGLTVDHGTGGVHDVDLALSRGTLTVVTGPVGSGKSTLLRAVLGLIDRDGGEIRWNGRVVDDPATTLVPPRAAYIAQTPRLFSEPLADSILLGVHEDGLDEAVRLACLDEDVAVMPDGLATVVGPRGVRLSGGQVQRSAAARALVRRPELLVIDDLSSALDVETESRLWRQLLDEQEWAGAAALLVVSHRPAVIARADQLVVLAGGRRTA